MDYEKLALEYHARSPKGKIFTGLSKPVIDQYDLSLAYTPGVAGPCRKIAENSLDSFEYTTRANLVAVVTNGTAVLGLGNIGPEAAKPVMEGKAMLFKQMANIDVFDLELDCPDTDSFIAAVKSLGPTFGGINLEDIKAPECFAIEEKLRNEMDIPVFHDDQHGTAIIAGAALINALEITGRSIEKIKIVFSGSGAAAIGCASLFLSLGVKEKNLFMCDSKGLLTTDRKDLNEYKLRYAQDHPQADMANVLKDADVFLGVSAAGVLKPEMLKGMAKNPIIFAMANPDPEIDPAVAREVRPDAIIATGRSDYPNQVNNVLGFPFIFRGALDVRATGINEEMKLAAVYAIAQLAKEDVPTQVLEAYNAHGGYEFGRDYLIPKPVDTRVLLHVAPAVAKAAMDSGVARSKIKIEEYKSRLEDILGPDRRVFRDITRSLVASNNRTGSLPKIVLTHAEDVRVIRAAKEVVEDGNINIILLGNQQEVRAKAKEVGLDIEGRGIEIIDPLSFERKAEFAEVLYKQRARKGVTLEIAKQLVQNSNYLASLLLKLGHADGIVTGLGEPYSTALKPLVSVVGVDRNQTLCGLYMMIIDKKLLFFADCTVNIDPDSQQLTNIGLQASQFARQYANEKIRIALLSYSSFGANRTRGVQKMRDAVKSLKSHVPSMIEVEGEMQADVAIDYELLTKDFPFCEFSGPANVLIFPNLESANISYKLMQKALPNSITIGPILLGMNKPANIIQRGANSKELVNLIQLTAGQVVES